MMETTQAPATPPRTAPEIGVDIANGMAPLWLALSVWRAHHGLTLADVGKLCGYANGSMSNWILRPDKLPGLGAKIATLIGYPDVGHARTDSLEKK